MPSDQLHDESQELLEVLVHQVRSWHRSAPGLRALDDLYRRLHTLKGLVLRRYGEQVDEQIHLMESVLDALRCSRLDPGTELQSVLVGALTGLRCRIVERGTVIPCGDRLQAILATRRDEEAFPPGFRLSEDLVQQLSKFERAWLTRAARENKTLVALRTALPLLKLDLVLPELQEGIGALGGEVIANVPGALTDSQDQIRFTLLTEWETPVGHDVMARLPNVLDVEAVYTAEDDPENDADAQTVLRLDIRQIEGLLATLGEMRQLRSSMTMLIERTIAAAPPTEGAVVRQTLRRENRLFFRVLEQALQLRLVELSSLQDRLQSEFENITKIAGVTACVELQLDSVQLDRSLVESLHGPLLHLIRNAVDHGLTGVHTPEIGCESRQRPQVRIVASQRGAEVEITVEDNGRGIDMAALAARAEEEGLVEDASVVSERELLACLFEPGFSSREKAGQLSGRGVGLDAVRSFVARVGGSVRVATNAGTGTSVTLVVPVSLGLQRVQLARRGPHLIGIPLRVIDRVDSENGRWNIQVHLGVVGATVTVDRILEQSWVAVHSLGTYTPAPAGVLGAFEHGVSSEVGYLVDPVVFARGGSEAARIVGSERR